MSITATGIPSDELVDIALRIRPTPPPLTPLIPLVLASTWDPATQDEPQTGDLLLGGVVNGEVCALEPDDFIMDPGDDCAPLDGGITMTVFDTPGGRGRYSGLVSEDVAELRIDFVDGTALTSRPTPQPVGNVQAFAVAYPGVAATSITAFGSDGRELQKVAAGPRQ